MKLAPPTAVAARAGSPQSRTELGIRYIAATCASLVAIMGAQLVVPNRFAILLVALTLCGLPVSVYLRVSGMRLGRVVLSRAVLNAATVLLSLLLSFLLVLLPLRPILEAGMASGNPLQVFWVRFSAGETVTLLMQLFLLFLACRSFAIIQDKDAIHTLVPSFSVLLLLLPVQKDLSVVLYFLLWTVVAAVLLALDHRSEMRAQAVAYVPALQPDQDVRLSARSLGGLMGFSLACAAALSYQLSLREPEKRSEAESAVTSLASRLTQLALSLPETTVNGGPERQIDFSSAPTAPGQNPLWRVEVVDSQGRFLRPSYFRLVTLSTYSGRSWSQGAERANRVGRSRINPIRWVRFPGLEGGTPPGGPGTPPPTFGVGRRPVLPGTGDRPGQVPDIEGFDFANVLPGARADFGPRWARVRLNLAPLVTNLGPIPTLPFPEFTVLRRSEAREVRLKSDGSLDVGVVPPEVGIRVISMVPPLPEYGVSWPQDQKVPDTGAKLSRDERARYLQLPASLPTRVREYAVKTLQSGKAGDSDWRRANRLVLALQENSFYTLTPPELPDGRDAVDFFLFDAAKRGYCTHFASALTVLCRSQGIPARVVSGFVNPEWQSRSGSGFLREGNAHAWTEVWVPGFGWRVLDATPADDRGANAPSWVQNWINASGGHFLDAAGWVQSRLWGSAAVLVTLVLLYFAGPRLRRRQLLEKMGAERLQDEEDREAIIQAYGRFARRLSKKFRPAAAWETPQEWIHAAQEAGLDLPGDAVAELLDIYLMARYDPRPLRMFRHTSAIERTMQLTQRLLR